MDTLKDRLHIAKKTNYFDFKDISITTLQIPGFSESMFGGRPIELIRGHEEREEPYELFLIGSEDEGRKQLGEDLVDKEYASIALAEDFSHVLGALHNHNWFTDEFYNFDMLATYLTDIGYGQFEIEQAQFIYKHQDQDEMDEFLEKFQARYRNDIDTVAWSWENAHTMAVESLWPIEERYRAIANVAKNPDTLLSGTDQMTIHTITKDIEKPRLRVGPLSLYLAEQIDRTRSGDRPTIAILPPELIAPTAEIYFSQ